jgi:hypothetical protein
MKPTIGLFYRIAALQAAKQEIERTPDHEVLGMDPIEWARHLTARFGLSEIVLTGEPRLIEDQREYTLRGYDIYSDRKAGERVRETAIRIEVPVIPSNTIELIWAQKLTPNTFFFLSYPLWSTTLGASSSSS